MSDARTTWRKTSKKEEDKDGGIQRGDGERDKQWGGERTAVPRESGSGFT